LLPQQSCDEHAAMVDALAQSDTAKAEKPMARYGAKS
jgi:DNA-binding FadR family transcriptional regulator